MIVPYCYLTNDTLDVNIKNIFDYIKIMHDGSDMSYMSNLSYVDEWRLGKEEIIQALYGESIDPKYNESFYLTIEQKLLPFLQNADRKSS